MHPPPAIPHPSIPHNARNNPRLFKETGNIAAPPVRDGQNTARLRSRQNLPGGESGRKRFRREPGSPSALRRRPADVLVLSCTPTSASVSRRNFFCPDSPPAAAYIPGPKTHTLPLPIPDLPSASSFLPPTQKGAPFYRSALYSPDFHPLNYFLISRTSANAWIAVLA